LVVGQEQPLVSFGSTFSGVYPVYVADPSQILWRPQQWWLCHASITQNNGCKHKEVFSLFFYTAQLLLGKTPRP
jgi:hypothetical protein